MSVNVNPPPGLKIPKAFLEDKEIRSYFERQNTILFQLWARTGGSTDIVAGKQVIEITNVDLFLTEFNKLIAVEADTTDVDIFLPPITEDDVGEQIDVSIIDATFDTFVRPTGGATIMGDSSVLMDQQWMSIEFTPITKTIWIAT